MSLSLKYNEGQSVRALPPLSPTFPCAKYEATVVSSLEKTDNSLSRNGLKIIPS